MRMMKVGKMVTDLNLFQPGLYTVKPSYFGVNEPQ